METFEAIFYPCGGLVLLAIACYLMWLGMRMAEDIHRIRQWCDQHDTDIDV